MFGMLGSRWRPIRQRRGETHDIQWLSARSWTNRWYPQGIDVGTFKGRSALAISWFRQDRRRTHLASRATLVDFDRSRHLDIMLAVRDDAGLLQPAPIHAGGLAWIGDRLFVAATRQGIWEFDLSGVRRISGIAARRVSGNPRRSLRDVAVIAERVRVHPVDLRCSFIGRVFDDGGRFAERVLIGEYRTDPRGRVGEFSVTKEGLDPLGTFVPAVERMQGAVRWGARTFVSQSDGTRAGTLWVGDGERFAKSSTALPAGCEDLAVDPETKVLWSLGEHPWRRVVRGIPLESILDA